MHAGDLGTFQDAIGSLLWIEVTHKQWHRNQKAGLDHLNTELAAFYTASRADQLSKLTPVVAAKLFSRETGYPLLRAKAAQTRHIVPFCYALAVKHRIGGGRDPFRFRPDSRLAGHEEEHTLFQVCLFEGLSEFFQSLEVEPFDPNACKAGMYKYLTNLRALNQLWRLDLHTAAERKAMPYHLRPKCHLCQHLVEDKVPLFGNPKLFWGYRDEDFVGTIKRIAAKSMHPMTLERRVMEKICIFYGLKPDGL
jgi:hypothetical protein